MNGIDEIVAANPFPGLRPFAEGEYDRFFGRRQQIAELAERIEKMQFIAVAGSSGCGKSSLVCAGLLSELAGRAAAGKSNRWCFAIMRPGNTPIANLAEKLLPVIGHGGSTHMTAGALYGRLRLGSLGLVEAVKMARFDRDQRVLVVVDQFEEIFRFKRMIDADEAKAFIKLLLNAAEDGDSPVSVVITLRSETLGYCDDFAGLPEAVSRGQYLVPKLTREQRKETIVGPVELRGFTIAPRLVQRILNDVSNNFDDLPVMQHVLSRSWARWAEACGGTRPLDLEDYQEVGTAKLALSQHADQAFQSLSGLATVVEKVFRTLTERVSEGVENRRPLDFDRLCRVAGADRAEVSKVVERFRRPDTAFLMPPRDISLDDNPVIDISHESLIRQWERLRDWARAEAKSRGMLLRLIEAAKLYNSGEGSLWRGPNLLGAIQWQQLTRPNPDWIELTAGSPDSSGAAIMESIERFLDLSSREKRREKLRRKLQVWGWGGLAIAIVVSLVGYNLLMQSTSTQLAQKSLLEMNLDPAVSARLALAAMDDAPDNTIAQHALRQSLATLEIAHTTKILQFDGAVSDVRYSRDGSLLLIAGGNKAWIYDAATFTAKGDPFIRDDKVVKAWLVSNNTILVTHTNDWQGNAHVQIQKVDEPTLRPISCEAEGDRVYAVAVSPDEHHLAVGCLFGDIHVLDLANPSAESQLYQRFMNDQTTVTALAFASRGDDAYLAGGYANGLINVWKIGQSVPWIGENEAEPGISPIFHDRAIRDLDFHPDKPDLLLTASDDCLVTAWQLDLDRRRLADGEKNTWILNHNRPVISAKFIAGKETTVMTVSDKRVRLWIDETRDRRQARKHQDWVNDANVSADGELLVTACRDGTAQLWWTRSADSIALLRGHRAEVTRAIFNPAGNRIVTASDDGTVRVWRIYPPRLISSSPQWLLSAVFSQDGGRVAVGEEGGFKILSLSDAAEEPERSFRDPTGKSSLQYTNLSWSRDGKRLLALKISTDITSPPQPSLWDTETFQEITPDWLAEYRTAAFNTERNELITVDQSGIIGISNADGLAENHSPALTFGGKAGYRYYLAASPDGRWIAADEAADVILWDRKNPDAPPKKLDGHKGNIASLQFSRDSKRLLTSSLDMTARIWSLDDLDSPLVLKGGHTASLYSAAFDPAGNFVATGGADGTICVWSAENGAELAALRWHGEGVNQVQFSPDGKSILSASDDGTVKLGQCETFLSSDMETLRQRIEELAIVTEEDARKIAEENKLFDLADFFPR